MTSATDTRRCTACRVDRPADEYRPESGRCRRCRTRSRLRRAAAQWDADPAFRSRVYGRVGRQNRRRDSALRAKSDRLGSRPSPADVAVLIDPTVSHADAARLLGRTRGAVVQLRSRLRKRLQFASSIRAHASNVRLWPRPATAA